MGQRRLLVHATCWILSSNPGWDPRSLQEHKCWNNKSKQISIPIWNGLSRRFWEMIWNELLFLYGSCSEKGMLWGHSVFASLVKFVQLKRYIAISCINMKNSYLTLLVPWFLVANNNPILIRSKISKALRVRSWLLYSNQDVSCYSNNVVEINGDTCGIRPYILMSRSIKRASELTGWNSLWLFSGQRGILLEKNEQNPFYNLKFVQKELNKTKQNPHKLPKFFF